MKRKKGKKRDIRPVAAAMRAVDMPEETDGSIVKVTMLGCRRALIENHRGIAEYTDESIYFAAPKGHLRVAGQGLEIRELNRECALVEGQISGIYSEN